MFMQLLLVLFVKIALGDSAIIRINNVNEFIGFSNNVSSGTNYSGTTVYLDSDLSFSDKTLEPIGNYAYHFLGVFDGQGHIISDLKMNSSSQFTGLFGYSEGLTIKNIVLDSSCSITCNFTGNANVRVGGIIGYCYSNSSETNIENSVNMADVTFSGNSSSLSLGGIAGSLRSSLNYPVYVKNCANYGLVTQSGIVSGWLNIGGIVGELFGPSSSSYIHVYNCLNYGAITNDGIINSLLLGGVSGLNYYAHIENCVSAGKIPTQNIPSPSFIGSIAGYVDSNTSIIHCYYTSGVGISKVYEGASSTPTITETPNSPSAVNSTLIANLNNYATNNDTWSKWLLNANNVSITFIINYGKGSTVNSQIVLLPDLANNSKHNFSGWYTDANLTTLFNLSQVDSNTTLYGMFCGSSNYTVTFDVNGGNELDENEMTAGCMSYYRPFPEDATRTGHTLTGWFTEREGGYKVETGDKVKSLNNHTLYAQWIPNNYTVIFDVNEGDVLSETSMTVTFNSPYGSLPTPTKEGYMFIGWFTYNNNGSVKNEIIVSIADNHTLYAHWEEVTNYVEIVFNTKDLSREDIEEIVRKYTDAEFTITGFEEESGEIKVIVKLTDNKEAENFVEKIRESSEMSNIKKINFISGDTSFSTMLCTILFFNIIFFVI